MFAEPLTRDRAEKVAKWFFIFGFLGLPWLWFANCYLFISIRKSNEVIARYVNYSAVGFLVSLFVFATWYTVLYTAFPNSALWVIKPNVKEFQPGMFSDSVYSLASTS